MSLNFPGHAAPAASFEVPLEMLSACHGRIDKQCATLRALVPHVAAQGADRPAQEAAAAVMRYFDSAALNHHADEEEDLFPALLESMAGSDAACLRELVAGLLAEHRALEVAWRRVRVALETITCASAQARLAGANVEALVGLYERHIAREEGELLPMAVRLLDVATLDRIGRAMRARRGITVEP